MRGMSVEDTAKEAPEHELSPSCWCHPVKVYENPLTGSIVWVHNRLAEMETDS